MDAKHILIVDDDKRMVERRAGLLRALGYEVFCAFNGKEGIKILNKIEERQGKLDLLILDLDMPGMRGDEMLEKIKEMPGSASLKVLIVTGMEEPHILKKNDTRDYERHPITRAKMSGFSMRGWDGKFKLLRKWHVMDWHTLEARQEMERLGAKPPCPEDCLTDRKFLEAVGEMLSEHRAIDRPRKENEPWRILIAEDDTAAREGMKKRLERNKAYEVLSAKDGDEALAILSRSAVDLVILDLEMPGTKGDEVLSVMGSNFVLRDIPVIVYTGILDWDRHEDCSLRRKVEKIGVAEAVCEKKKAGPLGRIFKLDASSMLLDKVAQLLEERRKWGYGYLKEPLTFFKNKLDRWMPGALEYYQPVDTGSYCYRNIKTFLCSYCMNEKAICPDFKHACEYNKERLSFYGRFDIAVKEPVFVCQACIKELYERNPNIGKYALMDKEATISDDMERRRFKAHIKKPPRFPMNQKVFEKVRDVIREAYCDVKPCEISPESDIRKDIFKKPFLYNIFLANIKVTVELEYDITLSDNDIDWFDTVGDIVNFIDERLGQK